MDLNKLLKETDSLKQAMASPGLLLPNHGITETDDLEKIVSATRSSLAEAVTNTSALCEQDAKKALGIGATAPNSILTPDELMQAKFGPVARLSNLAASEPETMAEWIQSGVGDASGLLGRVHASTLQSLSAIDFEELDRKEKERQQQMMFDMARDSSQHMVQQVAEHRAREDAKVEYARRSAEASEAALEAERQRTVAAQKDALDAKEDARIARSHMRISLWFAGGSLLLAAWALLKDQLPS